MHSSIHPQTDPAGFLPEILYEDNHLLVVNKPGNMLVQSDRTGDQSLLELLKEYIRIKYRKPGRVFLGLVHRLDRPVSGVVVFARTGKALARMNELFKKKKIKKTYWAIVKKMPPGKEGLLVHYLKKDQENNRSRAYDMEKPGTRMASLQYSHIASSENYHLLEIDLQTGRHHQIRVQLAKIGCPVRGDLKYGFPRSNADGGISLHARSLVFEHPVRKEHLVIHAEPPKEKLWTDLGRSARQDRN